MTFKQAVTVEDYRGLARRRLPSVLFHYIDGGSFDEVTLARNVDDIKQISLRQRVMRDMSQVDLSTTLFSQPLSMPVVLGPVGFSGMFARRGEVQAARAARAAGLPFCLSTVGVCAVNEVAQGAGTAPWFQLYVIKDRDVVSHLLDKAAAANVNTLVLTVDLAAPGARYRDQRVALRTGLGATLGRAVDGVQRPRWLYDVYVKGRPHGFGNLTGLVPSARRFSQAQGWIYDNFDPSVTWADVEWIKSQWRGRILIKGVMGREDAQAAVSAGADGIIVSNHGGRQLDGVRSTIAVLPEVAEAVDGAVPVLMDGGLRSGLDVLKALASGADACLLGRAWAFALAAGGEAGVSRLLASVRADLKTAMVLTGAASIAAVDRQMLDEGLDNLKSLRAKA